MVTDHAVRVLVAVAGSQLQSVVEDVGLGDVKSEEDPDMSQTQADLSALDVPVTTGVSH